MDAATFIHWRMQNPTTCRYCERVFKTVAARRGHETLKHEKERVLKTLKEPLDKWQR
jgi:hypothetical protein